MSARNPSRSGTLQWVVVLVVGVLVVAIVLGLGLISRLGDGQKVLDGARPVFAPGRLATNSAGIDFISTNVNLANPIVTPRGRGAAEVPALVAYVAKTRHVSRAQALALLQKNFPHTTALLEAIPLTAVTTELPRLESYLEGILKLSPAQLAAALKTNFPALAQTIANLPTVTGGWNAIPGLGPLTRFDGAPVSSVPQLRTYLRSDVIPTVAAQRANFESLDSTTSIDWIAPLLLIVGIVVILFAAAMILRNLRGVSPREALASAIVVPVVGVVVVALVLVISLIPRVSDGQKLLDGLRPVNAAARVHGDRVGINMVSAIVNTEDPIMTSAGGAAAEVPKLIAFVSSKTGLPPSSILSVLQSEFPHTAALLTAIPLSSVTAEIPGLVGFLTPAVVSHIPALLPTVLDAQTVTGGWNAVPGTAAAGATRFDGTPVRTMPQVRNYFTNDVIPVLETQRAHYDNLVSTSKIDFLGPLVLIIGIVVIVYGLLMVLLARQLAPQSRAVPRVSPAQPR